MIVALAVKLITLAVQVGLSPVIKGLNDIWDIIDKLHAPPQSKRVRSRMLDLMRRHEARRIVKALRG